MSKQLTNKVKAIILLVNSSLMILFFMQKYQKNTVPFINLNFLNLKPLLMSNLMWKKISSLLS